MKIMVIPALLFAGWLWTELTNRPKKLRIILGIITFVVIAFMVVQAGVFLSYTRYHHRLAFEKMNSLLVAGDIESVINAIAIYDQAIVDEKRPSFVPEFKLREALGDTQ